MEEPYLTIQDIGRATEKLAADSSASPGQKFAEAQKQFKRLTDAKSSLDAIPVDWEQYIVGIEISLQRIQAEVRPQLNQQDASQIFIKTQAELGRHKVQKEEEVRYRRRAHRKKIKQLSITTTAIVCILLIVGLIGAYQWNVLTGNEGWFHDISQKRWQLIENRIRFGKSIETKDHMGMTGFLYLARTGTLEDLKKMKQLGADIHATDHAGRSALHHAAASANRSSIEWLISQGIDVNVTDHSGTTPLHYFFQKAPGTRFGMQSYDYLLDQGARTDTANDEESLFMAAVLWVRGGAFNEKPADILQQLIDKGAKVNHRGINSSTALDNALVKYLPKTPEPLSLIDSDPIVRLLVKNGATHERQNMELSEELESEENRRLEFLPGL